MLKVNEIFSSIQGESSFAGLPCTFIRLTYCNLRCVYCDTEYAFEEGSELTIDQILNRVRDLKNNLVEVTGGEPLFQNECHALLDSLIAKGYTVLLETGGSLPVENVNPQVRIIMDLKCPSSGMMKKNRMENLPFLKRKDEVKFVIGDRNDYEWCKEIIFTHKLYEKVQLLLSCVFNQLQPVELAKWILEDSLPVRFQLQMHKYIWDPNKRGV